MVMRLILIIFFLVIDNSMQADIWGNIGSTFKKGGDAISKGVQDLGSGIKKGGEQAVGLVNEKLVNPVVENTQSLDAWVLPDSNKRF